MLFTYGDVQKLKGREWLPLELHGENCMEIYLRRLVRSVSGIFKDEPVEIYVPVKDRDLDEFELQEGPFIYVRSLYFIGMVRLKKVWGVVGLVTKGGSKLLKDTLKVSDEYVQHLMVLEESAKAIWQCGFKDGCGVRILDGTYRDFCGTVVSFSEHEQAAIVLIDMGFRKVELKTWLGNLRVVSAQPIDCCWVPGYLREKEASSLQTEAAE